MSGKSKQADDDLIDDDLDWEVDSDDDAAKDDLITGKSHAAGPRQRDWRDLERYKEERELKKLMEDDLWLDDL